jgi:hypothetical protein
MIGPPPVLKRNFSDEEILGLLTHSPPRSRREANRAGRDAGAQDPAPGATRQSLWFLAMRKFSMRCAQAPQRTPGAGGARVPRSRRVIAVAKPPALSPERGFS